MARSVSARRYAQAIYQLALEKDHLENWIEDLSVLAASVSDELFVSFADSPKVETDQKTAVIKEAFAGTVSELAMNLVCLLAARSSVSSLPAIADSFQELVDVEKGLVRAEITSAITLTDDQRTSITTALTNIVGKELTVTTRVDESIVGGFVAKVGDRLIDGSLKTRLEDMKRELVRGT